MILRNLKYGRPGLAEDTKLKATQSDQNDGSKDQIISCSQIGDKERKLGDKESSYLPPKTSNREELTTPDLKRYRLCHPLINL